MNKIINYTDKPITEFNSEDTFFGVKKSGEYEYTFFCQFVKFEKGILYGKVCGQIQPNNHNSIWIGKEYFQQTSEISFRISKCYTFSNRGCHWFKKDNGEYKSI